MNNEPTPGEPIPISTQKSLSSGHDPGWNDPPKWAYSHSPTLSITPTKRVLNKRVAFPLDSTPPTSNFDPNQPLTPPPANMPPPPLTAVRSSGVAHLSNVRASESFGREKALEDSLQNFENVIDDNEELGSKKEDIGRRLKLMETAWTENKLDETICRKVLNLSVALRNKDVDAADKIHVSLIMEHAALCGAWIPAIRHMILSTREKHTQENQPSEDNSTPYLLPCTDSTSTQSAQ